VILIALIALFGWVPVVILLFALLPARKAATVAELGAWLLLPPIGLLLPGLPDYSKTTAAVVGIVLGTLFFNLQGLLAFRPRWYDLPMVLWCLTGVFSSVHNGLGIYDGLSNSVSQFVFWGLPYFIGRLYFNNLEGQRIFTVGIVIAGLLCILPCLWEIRMSPQLQRHVYGIEEGVAMRLGGFRPQLFFRHGLELGLWMSTAALSAWWLWRCGVIKRIRGIQFGAFLLPALMVTTVLCRSTGALAILVLGLMVLWLTTRFNTKFFLAGILALGPLYVAVRIPNLWSGQHLVDFFKHTVSAERAKSLADRLNAENLLVAKAIEQPIFGWGGWDRSAVYTDDDYRDAAHAVPPDGLWIAVLGPKGFVGLILLYIASGLPVALFLRRFPVRLWSDPRVAPATLVATLVGLSLVDNLFNGSVSVALVTLAGGLISITPAQLGDRRAQLRGTRTAASDPGGMLQTNALKAQPGRAELPGPQPGRVLPHSIASRLAAIDRYRNLGRRLKADKRWADARSAWQQALDSLTELATRHSDFPELERRWCDCANDVAWLVLNHPDSDPRGPAHALALANEVVDRHSDCEVYWNTLGAALLRNGDPAGAIAALNRAMSLSEQDNPFNDVFLALAYARVGDCEQAQPWLAQAIHLKDQYFGAHPELTSLCDEALAALGTNSAAGLGESAAGSREPSDTRDSSPPLALPGY
jgi:tetratricopeptide (TPR) repeat protein